MSTTVAMLKSLDRRLLLMMEDARSRGAREHDPFRGWYISETEALQSLESQPPVFEKVDTPIEISAPISRLGELYGLHQFELEVLAVALAPEFDTRYERVFGFLQDDVNRTRPGIDLVLRVLGAPPEARAAFEPNSRLLRNRIIRLTGDENSSFLRRSVVPDSRIAALAAGDAGIDPRIASFVCLVAPEPVRKQVPDAGLLRIFRAASQRQIKVVVHLQGPNEEEKRAVAVATAAELKAPLLIVELDRAASVVTDMREWLRDVSREAFLQDAILYRAGLDKIADEQIRSTILSDLANDRGVSIISGSGPWQPENSGLTGVMTIPFAPPDWAGRRSAWQSVLSEHHMRVRGTSLDLLAECFRFDKTQIRDVAGTAENLAVYRSQALRSEHLFEAARLRSGHELGALARKVTPVYDWDHLVLQADALAQLREICGRVKRRHHVIGKWGFGVKLSGGKGVNALFYGHSGTGKTMAAEVIAKELQLDLFKIDLAGVVSKYIGETEKNLDRIFTAAETANAILFIDEADALFGKRSEVKDSHDRYANLEISYLLQKMEAYEGVAILATNLRQNLDDAFVRRLAFMVAFAFPDEASRRKIWGGIWPAAAPLSSDVDLDYLAATFTLSGGNIRNVALAAAFQAAEANTAITMRLVLEATRREFQKLGKTFGTGELSTAFDRRTPLEAIA